MTVDFIDYFWGEKNNGFDVLYHNMKYGQVASKELAEFLRERSSIEEVNSKQLSKLAKQASSGCVQGTFSPLWQVIRNSADKLSTLHLQMVQKVSELVKEVTKYADDMSKKHKTVKEEESGTLEIVQAIQSTALTLQKAKDAYVQKSIEFEKINRENASPKDIEKAEVKLKKAQEDYKILVEKYSTIQDNFEKKMSLACKHFQDVEEAHLRQMKEFLNTYSDLLDNNHDLIGQVHIEFKRQCLEMTVDKLLEQFVLNKYTGLEKPGPVEFEELNLSGVSSGSNQTPDSSDRMPTNGDNKPTKKEGFLRSRREKRKEKKTKKKKDDNTSNKDDKTDIKSTSLDDSRDEKEDRRKSGSPSVDVDEDGFCIRPKVEHWENDKGSFYSSSDSDTDDERERKIHIEIKPLSNGSAPMSASVDELRATVENLSLSPIAVLTMGRRGSNSDPDHFIKRSQSVSQQLGGPAPGSAASTPTGSASHPYAPLQSPTQRGAASPAPLQPHSSRYADLGDLFCEVGDMQPALPPKQRQTPTPTSISIPRPPSRRSDAAASRASPALMARADSIASLEFRAAGVPVGSSRGPSPLTIGMSDTIPLAVAFHEIIHAYFRGSDESKCQVKMSGDMMLSFPAGIVSVLANNPSPSLLSFRIRNSSRLDNVLPNKQLVSMDASHATSDSLLFEFNMSALTALLRRQSEQNPAASYFNVDILKYQIKPKLGAGSCPFQLVAYWKCEVNHTDLKVDYKYNCHAMAQTSPLLNLTVAAPVDGGVKNVQSKPVAQWMAETNRAVWKLTELSPHGESHGVGSLRARLEVTNGPSNQGTIATQFNCEGTTLSGVEFDLVGNGYRVSLVKRRFVSGKYICDGDYADPRSRYAAPPSSADC